MSRFQLYGVSAHAGQGAPQCKISTFLVEIVPASVPNVELRDSRTIFFPILLPCLIPLGTPLSKTPKQLTLPNNSATSVETIYEQGKEKLAAISHPEPRRCNILLGLYNM